MTRRPVPVAASPELRAPARAAATGRICANLRREGLSSSNLIVWRRQHDAAAISGLAPARRGPKGAEPSLPAAELARPQQDDARLTRGRLTRARMSNTDGPKSLTRLMD